MNVSSAHEKILLVGVKEGIISVEGLERSFLYGGDILRIPLLSRQSAFTCVFCDFYNICVRGLCTSLSKRQNVKKREQTDV